MTNLTNFNDFALNTEESTNVNGGWGCRTRKRSYSYSSYSSYSYGSCQPSYSYYNCCDYTSCEVEATPEVEPVVEEVIATPDQQREPAGIAAA